MAMTGGCHCGAIRYEVSGEPQHHALCHCVDCRRSAGAPIVGWAAFAESDFKVTKGAPVTYASSEHGRRGFCGACGTGLTYTNAVALPGIVDIQSATLDDPAALPAQIQIQTADRIAWMEDAHTLPAFERYPSPP
jgi:hypothetical protein